MLDIKKVENNGKNIEQKKVINFLTVKGYRCPQYMYVGYDNFGTELYQPTKRELISAIERNNRIFSKYPEKLNLQ